MKILGVSGSSRVESFNSARSRLRQKRGGDAAVFSLDDVPALSYSRAAQFVALDDALNELAALEPRRSQVVELRYFGL